MKLLPLALAFGLATASPIANAVFFFFVPLPGGGGGYCTGSNAKVGDKITIPGKGRGIVVSVSGASPKCKDDRYP